MKLAAAALVALFVYFLVRRFAKQRITSSAPAPRQSHLSIPEALEILGLEPTQNNPNDVIEAHRRLMQRVHPDKGGSAHLAKQLNEAKRILLAAEKP